MTYIAGRLIDLAIARIKKQTLHRPAFHFYMFVLLWRSPPPCMHVFLDRHSGFQLHPLNACLQILSPSCAVSLSNSILCCLTSVNCEHLSSSLTCHRVTVITHHHWKGRESYPVPGSCGAKSDSKYTARRCENPLGLPVF